MNSYPKTLCTLLLGLALAHTHSFAQTDGAARMAVTINDYTGTTSPNHWTLVWVTTEAGVFIKTLWKQGTSYPFNSTQWTTHTPQWNAARGGVNGSTIVDGYTSATATSYTGTNSPVILTWNCRDTNNVLVADGNYKFWVQYAENSGAGPYTTNGLLWVKGATGVTNNYANLSPNFTSMQVAWRPSTPAPVAPTITSLTPPATGTVGVPYNFTVTATGTAPITFTAPGLPTGVAISGAGVISGTATTAGTFTGTITAANGTPPNATQNFSIVIGAAPVAPTITSLTPPATGTVGVPYNFTVTTTGTAPITFTAPGLPTGVAISGAGIISGTPTTAGTFTGTITAANGTLPNATQNFSIVTSVVPTDFTVVQLNGNSLVMSGNGPANGFYAVLVATSPSALPAQWTAIATNAFDNAGKFSFTNAISPGVPQEFYRLRVP